MATHRSPSERTALYVDGELVYETDFPQIGFDAPAREATYRLSTEQELDEAVYPLSRRLSVEWTFRSAHVPDCRTEMLPLMVVRFAPPLDGYNRASAGRVFVVRISIESNQGAAASPVTEVTTQVSYDDGVAWQDARTVRIGDRWYAALHHPVVDGYVSLRATAVDQGATRFSRLLFMRMGSGGSVLVLALAGF